MPSLLCTEIKQDYPMEMSIVYHNKKGSSALSLFKTPPLKLFFYKHALISIFQGIKISNMQTLDVPFKIQPGNSCHILGDRGVGS